MTTYDDSDDRRDVAYYSRARAAIYANVSERTIDRWLDRGLPSYRSGPRTKILIRPDDIDTFLSRWRLEKKSLDSMVDDVMRELGNRD